MSNRFLVGLSTFPSCVKKTNITLATKKRDWEYFVGVVDNTAAADPVIAAHPVVPDNVVTAAAADITTKGGTGHDRNKKTYRGEWPGDNPMDAYGRDGTQVKEDTLWKSYERMIKDIKS